MPRGISHEFEYPNIGTVALTFAVARKWVYDMKCLRRCFVRRIIIATQDPPFGA